MTDAQQPMREAAARASYEAGSIMFPKLQWEDIGDNDSLLHQALREKYMRRADAVARVVLEAAAEVADQHADQETRKALGANAAINAANIAAAIRALAPPETEGEPS